MLRRRTHILAACLTIIAFLAGGLLLAGDHGAQAYTPTSNPYDIAPPAPGNAPPQGATTDPDPAPPPGGPPWYGEVHILVLLIQFPDYPASSSHDVEYFEDLLFGHRDGSMWDFFDENSYGQFSINGTVVPVWLNATHNMSYYGSHEFSNSEAQGNAQTLVREAVQLADEYVDFGPFDEDGDGYVDHLAMVHSGPCDESNGNGGPNGERGPDGDPAIWSHRWGITAEQVDGVNVTGYFMQGEGTPMGVFAHEYGHNLGLPDLYDTDYSSSGIGKWGIMSGGSWNNGGRTPAQFCAWSKIAMGWLEPTIPSGTTANLTVPRIEDHDVAFKLPIGGRDSPEYFLFENRQKVLYDTYLPSHGLLIWHIDEEASQPNDSHRLVDLEEFDNNDNPNQGTEPWANSSAGFHDDSAPNAHAYSGDPTGFSIFAISNSSDNMTVRVTLPRNVAVVGVGPALAELNQALDLTLAVQNRGFINETDITAHLRVLDDGGTEVFNRSTRIDLLEIGESTTLTWEWTPATRRTYTLEGWIDWNDSLPGDDQRSGELDVTTIFMAEDFEGSTDDWTTSNDGSAGMLWHLTDRHSISGEQSYWQGRESHGSYLDNMDQSLITPELNLSGLKWVTLTFQHRYHIELNYDGGVVDISTDNGSTWSRLTPEEGYDAGIAALGWQAAYTGGSEGWRLANFNLTDHVNETIHLRFRFASDAGVVDEGWFIDDVILHGTYEREVDLALSVEDLSPLPGATETFEVLVTNSGGEAAQFDLASQVPAGWSLTDLTASVELEPSETRVLEVNLTLPSQVEAGSYLVNVTATHHEDANVSALVSLPVEVQEVTGLQMLPDPVTDHDEPGALLSFVLDLSNHGNVHETVSLSLEGLTGWVENTTVELAPYASIDNVTVWVRIPAYANASQEFAGYVEGVGTHTSARANLTLTADQVYGIEIAAETDSLTVLPADNLTLDLKLTNTGNGPAWCNATLTLPDGWWTPQLNFSAWLARDENASWRVNLTPDWELVDTVEVLRIDAESGSATDLWERNLTYDQLFDLMVDDLAEGVMLRPDENRTFSINLTNNGNGPEEVELQAWLTNGDDWSLGWMPGGGTSMAFSMASEETRQIDGWYRPPADALGGHVATLWIVVDSSDNATQGRNGQLEVEKLYGFTVTGNRSSIETGQDDNETWGLEVANLGNVPLEVNLTLDGAESWHHGWIDDPRLELEVNGRENVSVWVTGNRSVLKDTLGELRAIATAGELEENETVELVMGAYHGDKLFPILHPPQDAVPEMGAQYNYTLLNQANYQRSFNVTPQPDANWTLELIDAQILTLEAWTQTTFAIRFTPKAEAYLMPNATVDHSILLNEIGHEPHFMLKHEVTVGTYHGLELQGPSETVDLVPERGNVIELNVTNLGNEPALLNQTLSELPAGWQAQSMDLEVNETLGPGVQRTFSLEVTPDTAALAGATADLNLTLLDNWTADNLTLNFRVAPSYGLAVEESEPGIEVANGQRKSLEFIIHNTGNLEQAVDLTLIPLQGFHWLKGLHDVEATVPAFGQTAVEAWVEGPDEALGDEWFKGRLQVSSQDDGLPSELKAYRDFIVEVADRPSVAGQLRFDNFKAGRLSEAYLELTNDGNVPLYLNISVTQTSWGENLTHVYVHYLDPGDEKNITLRLEPPESYAGNASILVTLESPAFAKDQTVSGMVNVQAAPEDDEAFPWVRLLLGLILLVVIVALALPLVPWRRRESDDDDLDPGGPRVDGAGQFAGGAAGARHRGKPNLVDHAAFARPRSKVPPSDGETGPTPPDDATDTDEGDDTGDGGDEAGGVGGSGEVDEASDGSPSSDAPSAPEPPAEGEVKTVAPELLEPPKPAVRLGRTTCPNCEKPILINDEVAELGKASCFWCNTKVSLKAKE